MPRIHEIARDTGFSSKAILFKAKQFGLGAKSASSMLLGIESQALVAMLVDYTPRPDTLCCWCDEKASELIGPRDMRDAACYVHADKYRGTYFTAASSR